MARLERPEQLARLVLPEPTEPTERMAQPVRLAQLAQLARLAQPVRVKWKTAAITTRLRDMARLTQPQPAPTTPPWDSTRSPITPRASTTRPTVIVRS